MKKFLILTFISVLSLAAVAQPYFTDGPEKAYILKKVTTDSATTNVDSLVIRANEAGIIQIRAIGFNVGAAGGAVTGIITYKYQKVAGTLTLGSVVNILPIVANTAVAAATFSVVSSGNNLVVKMKGQTGSITMNWRFEINRWAFIKP